MAVKKILVVEDDETILLLEQKILEEAGYEVDTAMSGKAGLELAKANRYTVVVADVMMPEMDGFELTREIEKLYQKSVPVLLVTAINDALKEAKKRDARPMSTLQKPFSPSALLTAVRLLEAQSQKGGRSPQQRPAKAPTPKKTEKKGWLGKLLSK